MAFRPSAIVFLLALLTGKSRAFAAGGAPSDFNSMRHRTSDYEHLAIPSFSNRKRHVSINNKDSHNHSVLTQLRAGGSSLDKTIPPPTPPSNLSLLKFYVPCLALWISGPLLSLVDTSFVGLSAKANALGGSGSAAQLAALGPATTFIDGSLYLFAFLNVATTNLYASALALENAGNRGNAGKKNKSGNEEKPGEGVVRTAARTSLYSGIGLMVFLLAVARPLIALYIGE